MTKKIISFLFAFLIVFLSQNEVQAGVVCTGTACQYIPQNIMNELQTIDVSLQKQYTDKVMSSMSEAAVLTNLNSGMIGKGSVNRFELGLGAGAAGVKNDDIIIKHGETVLPKMPNMGVALSPTLAAGVNLGWLLGGGAADKASKKNLLHRISLYAHGFSYKFNNGNIDRYTPDGMSMYGSISNAGVMARFQLFQEKNTMLKLLGFNGLSLGLGYNYQRQAVHANYQDKNVPTVNFGPVEGSWAGETKLDLDSRVRSTVFDLRTGFRVLYALTFLVGIGTSVNTGTSDLNVERSGPFRLGTDLSLYSASPELAKYLNSTNTKFDQEGNLSLSLKGHGKPEYRVHYVIAGTEINIANFKILLEGYMAEKSYAANLGFKFAL